MEILTWIFQQFQTLIKMLDSFKIPMLGNVSYLVYALFMLIMGFLIDFLLGGFGMKKGGKDD